MMQDKKRVIQIIADETQKKGFFLLKWLTPTLEQHGISREIYNNQGPKRWLISSFPGLRIEGSPGKEVVILPDAANMASMPHAQTVFEEKIDTTSLAKELNANVYDLPLKVGVISFCSYKYGFINPVFGDGASEQETSSVRFNPSNIKTIPERFVFNTYNNVYLVAYATSGTIINRKTGDKHPAIDLSIPVYIARAIPKRDCAYIRIVDDEITIGTIGQLNNVLSEENKKLILSAIKEKILNSNGAIKPSEIPQILDSLWEHGITKSIYRGEPLLSWIKTHFPKLFVSPSCDDGGYEYIFLREVTAEDIERVSLSVDDNERIKSAILQYLHEFETIPLKEISKKVFMPNGLDIRFYPIGENINCWLAEQSEFIISEDGLNVSLAEGYTKPQPQPSPEPIPIPAQIRRFEDIDAEEVEQKYNYGQYADLLSSDCFRRLNPSEIPLQYMEKAITAARRILFGPNEKAVHLNAFQQALLIAKTNSDYSDWIRDASYDDSIIEQCLNTMMFRGTKSIAAKMVNELVHKSSRNDQYLDSATKKTRGVVARFQMAKNEQVLPLYVLAAFSQSSPSNVNTLVFDYCKFVQELNNDTLFLANNRGLERSLFFSNVLNAIIKSPSADGIILEPITQTLVLSVFVDTFCFETLDDDLIATLFPNEESQQRSLIRLIKHHELWSEADFIEFISKDHSLQLLERSISLVWGQIIGNSVCDDLELFELPESFLRLLSWIISYCDRPTIEAIIDFTTIASRKKVSRQAKCVMLLRSLPHIQKLSEIEPSCYKFGSYLSHYLSKEIGDNSISSSRAIEISARVSSWNAYSAVHFENKLKDLSIEFEDRKKAYANLFQEFWFDKEHEMLLQKMYADELLANNIVESSDIEEAMRSCLSIRAYDAYCLLYKQLLNKNTVDVDEKHIDEYVNALIQNEEYCELLNYLLTNSTICEDEKNKYLIQAIYAIFCSYHYSEKSFSYFIDRFTVDEANSFLQKQLTKVLLQKKPAINAFQIITSLIAIFIYQNDLFRARYLYEIFHSRAEIGNTSIYLQFKKLLDSKSNHVLQPEGADNHFNVIQTAFYVLPPHSLIKFLSWASEIKIPDRPYYSPQHVHILAMTNFLSAPYNSLYWQKFLQHLSLRLTQYPANAWLVCVCDGVLSSVWNLSHDYDVHRAYELVLTQIQDPNIRSRFFPVGLLPYICAYIVKKDDEQLCRNLIVALSDVNLRDRLLANNPWSKDHKATLSAFTSFCIRKIKETKNPVYSDLLKTIAPTASVEDLVTIASDSRNVDYVVRQICGLFLEGSPIGEAQNIFSQIDRSNLSFQDSEAIELLQTIYTDESLLMENYPKSFLSEEEVFRFRQDCAMILYHYPKIDGLIEFEKSATGNSYKRLVFSYAFGAFYSKEIYEKYSFDYDAFSDRSNQVIFATFLQKVFCSQLVYNASYDFFYKIWRYLKLYLAKVIAADGPADITDIIGVMKQHHHDDSIMDEFFLPFKQTVDAFWELPSISAEEKKTFLYCIILGQFSEYLHRHANTMLTLPVKEASLVQKIVSMLDYREVSLAIYEYYDSELKAGVFHRAKTVAAALVPAAFDAICELENSKKKADAYQLFKTVLSDTPALCVKAMIQMDDVQYQEFHHLINPMICSLQFPFQIYKRFHLLVLQKKERSSFQRYGSLYEYLERTVDQDAKTVYLYLAAVQAGDEGDRKKAQHLLQMIAGEFNRIPLLWQDEANALRSYSIGEAETFRATRDTLDASASNAHSKERYLFSQLLLTKLAPERLEEEQNRDSILAAWRCYQDDNEEVSEYNRIVAGAQALNAPKQLAELAKGLGVSALSDKLAFDLGMVVFHAKGELPISADDRLSIAAELLEHNQDSRILFPQFDHLLRSGTCSIDSWCRHRNMIRKFVNETGYVSDASFTRLDDEILKPCAVNLTKLSSQQYSREEFYSDLQDYKNTLTGIEDSTFRRLIYSAIDRRINEIINGVRLVISVENADNITDNYLYFSVENVGNQSVASADVKIQVHGLSRNLESSFEMLHPQYIVGGRVEITAVPGNELIVQILYANTVLSRVVLKKSIIKHLSGTAIALESDDLYNVRRAIQVYGREQQLSELHKLMNSESKALIYGPSRIGKTSILDLVRKDLAAKKGNVISVTFAGEGSAKWSDYQEIPPGASTEAIEECLLVGSILKAFEEKGKRLQLPASVSETVEQKICEILKRPLPIPRRYRAMNDYLENCDLELWLILDEFQQILDEAQQAGARWVPEETGAFARICADLSEESRIKLIICGSDDLLKHMVLKKSSIWRRILPPDPFGVQVKALDPSPFMQMLRTEPLRSARSVEDVGLSYSPKALEALYSYTGGVPLYGKQIGNQVLKSLRTLGDLKTRNKIYTADITAATKILIHEQGSDKTGDIYAIYDAVTKGLSKQTDEVFLAYIAQYMTNNRVIGCPYSAFIQNPSGMLKIRGDGEEPYKILDDSLAIAEARGIIRKVDPKAANPCYMFCTVFYYSAFLGTAMADLHLEDKLFSKEDDEAFKIDTIDEDPYDFQNIMKIAPEFDELYTPKEQRAFLGALALSSDSTVQDSLKRLAGTTQSGHIFNGDVKILQVNQIANSLSGLSDLVKSISLGASAYSEEQMEDYLSDMPRLSLLPAGNPTNEDDDLSKFDTDSYAETVEEGVKKSFEANSEFNGKSLEDWAREHIERLTEMDVSEDDLDFALTLPERDRDSVLIALYLRCLFDEIVDLSERAKSSVTVDYAPVSIMLSKPLERLLKEKHLPIYQDSTVWVNQVSTYGDKKPPALISFSGLTTIGTFKTALFSMFKIDKNDPEKAEKEENKENFVRRTGTSERKWKPYMYDLNTANSIRNKTAHVETVTQELCDQFVTLVFKNKLLMNTIEYIHNPTSN